MSLLRTAIEIATEAHDGQLDKAGRPYIFHPLRVMERLNKLNMTDEVVAAGVLHDVIEDTEWNATMLSLMKIPDRVIEIVVAVSKTDNIPYDEFIDRILGTEDREIITVKFADMHDNYLRIDNLDDEATKKRLRKKYNVNLARLGQLAYIDKRLR